MVQKAGWNIVPTYIKMKKDHTISIQASLSLAALSPSFSIPGHFVLPLFASLVPPLLFILLLRPALPNNSRPPPSGKFDPKGKSLPCRSVNSRSSLWSTGTHLCHYFLGEGSEKIHQPRGRHDICQIFCSSIFVKSWKFSPIKRVNPNIFNHFFALI